MVFFSRISFFKFKMKFSISFAVLDSGCSSETIHEYFGWIIFCSHVLVKIFWNISAFVMWKNRYFQNKNEQEENSSDRPLVVLWQRCSNPLRWWKTKKKYVGISMLFHHIIYRISTRFPLNTVHVLYFPSAHAYFNLHFNPHFRVISHFLSLSLFFCEINKYVSFTDIPTSHSINLLGIFMRHFIERENQHIFLQRQKKKSSPTNHLW